MKSLLPFLFFLITFSCFGQKLKIQDGKHILNKQHVTGIAIYKDHVWLGTLGGIIKLNKALTNPQIADDPSILPGEQILYLVKHSGSLWIAGNAGVARYNGKSWTKLDLNASSLLISKLAFDASNTLWIAGNVGFKDTKVIKWNAKILNTFDNTDGLNIDMVTGLAVDREGHIWLSTYAGLNEFNGSKWKTYNTSSGLSSNYITGIAIANNDRLWVGTKEHGINILKNGKWSHIGSNEGPNFSQIDELTKAHNGLIIAISGTEFSTFDGNVWRLYKPDLSEKQFITTVKIDRKNFYIGTNKGLVVYPRITN